MELAMCARTSFPGQAAQLSNLEAGRASDYELEQAYNLATAGTHWVEARRPHVAAEWRCWVCAGAG